MSFVIYCDHCGCASEGLEKILVTSVKALGNKSPYGMDQWIIKPADVCVVCYPKVIDKIKNLFSLRRS